uniref:Zn(2)-C6 fungal-type domain-containing protein n=3 Tax=Bionectria ochroleuca TaxID=29856 RepID=A0A0B7K7M5_BIOOC
METSQAEQIPQVRHKFACSLCARRKVKCDKLDPCSNCIKVEAQCLYEVHPPPRPRKRAADDELVARLAAYETLMRKHDIDFSHCATTWVPSGQEVELGETEPLPDTNLSLPSNSVHDALRSTDGASSMVLEKSLWSNLIPELKNPPIVNLRHKYDPFLHLTPPLDSFLSTPNFNLHEMHPEPKHIYRFWQIFVERVNPLTKIIHVPTLQQRVLDASWDLASISKPFTAMLFAIYTLAVTSISDEECEASFQEKRLNLLMRYRTASIRALVAAEFLTTRDLEVLQAFVLFLFSDPESELTSTLTGAALRIGQKIGLHRPNNPKVSFFENEMRIRLWWNLAGLDARSRGVHVRGMAPPPHREFGDVRLPLNVNDADLHPDMTEAPAQHDNPTEMICALVKFQVFEWGRTGSNGSKVFESMTHPSSTKKGIVSMELKEAAINEIEQAYRRILQRSDKRIPLHQLAQTWATIIPARLRFKIYHPRLRPAAEDGTIYVTRKESDETFEAVLLALEMSELSLESVFATYLVIHLTFWFKMEAYVYVISELRQRCSGPRIDLAWRIIEKLFDNLPAVISEEDETFFSGLINLTLEAWEARRKELLTMSSSLEADLTPPFIRSLYDRRRERNEDGMSMAAVLDSHSLDGLGFMEGDAVDWQTWSDVFRF